MKNNKTKMNINISIYLILAVAAVILFGCSSTSKSPVQPGETLTTESSLPDSQSSDASSRQIIGAGEFNFDTSGLTASTLPPRDSAAHFSLKNFLPVPYLHVNTYDALTGIIDVDVTLRNPTSIDAFDLRLIIYSDNTGVRLKNPDAWTALWDIPGGASINPFIAYAKVKPLRKFASGDILTERLLIYFPNGSGAINFAIDASWPGNCEEPFSIDNFHHGDLSSATGSETLAEVRVADHQTDVSNVSLYCPAVTGTNFVSFTEVNNQRWQLNLVNATGVAEGKYLGFVIASSANSGSTQLLKDVIIDVVQASKCSADGNDSIDTASLINFHDTLTGCVDEIDSDWFIFYTPPTGIQSATIDLNIDGGSVAVNLYGSMPGEALPGTLLSEDQHIVLGKTPQSRYLMNIVGISGQINYELVMNVTPVMANIDTLIFVATDDGTPTGKWPLWEEPDPDEELNITTLTNLMTWTNNLWNQYGYNMKWDGQVTIMDSKYYINDEEGEDGEMHARYGQGSKKLCMYFDQSAGTAYCYVYYPTANHNVDNVFTVYGPNVWYWQDVVVHEWGHGFGYLFDEYIYSGAGCECGDNVCIGGEPFLYWIDDGCYYGNIMWYAIVGWTWDQFNFTARQSQAVNRFHFQNPGNFIFYE